jgi:hypothetical protein
MSHSSTLARPGFVDGRRRPVFSARWTRIAPDSKTETPASRSTIAGILLFGQIRPELLVLSDVDGVDVVRQAALFQHDGNLAPVRCGPGVEIDHRPVPPDGSVPSG